MRSARGALAWWPCVAVPAAVALVLFLAAPQGTALDFRVFHAAAGRWLRGEPLYDPSTQFSFKYAPVVAALLSPLALVPVRPAWLLLDAASIAALLRIVRWSAARAGLSPTLPAQALLLALAAPWWGHLLWLGQVDAILLWLVVESEAQRLRRPLVAGALLAAVVLVKPPFLVLTPLLMWRRETRRILGLAAALPALAVIGALRYGAGAGAVLAAWPRLLSGSTPGLLCYQFNQSAFALSCTYFGRPGTTAFLPGVAALAAATAVGAILAVRRIQTLDPALSDLVAFGAAAYLAAFLSPLGWNTNLVNAIPLACALLALGQSARERVGTGAIRRVAIGAALLVAGLNAVDLPLLPLRLWGDTAASLLWLRQYAVAGLVLYVAALAGWALAPRPRPSASPA